MKPSRLRVCCLFIACLRGGAAIEADEPIGAWPSPLRKSVGKEWTLELEERQVPPNRGSVLVSVGNDSRSALYRSDSRTLPLRPGSVSDLSREQCERLLDLAVQAREALAFGFPLQGVFDSSNVSLRMASGRRKIELEFQGAAGEINFKLLQRLQAFADTASPRTMSFLQGVWHQERDGAYAYAARTPKHILDAWQKKATNITRVGSEEVFGSWQIELHADSNGRPPVTFVLSRDGTVNLGEADADAGKETSNPTLNAARKLRNAIILNTEEREQVLALTLKAINDFTFDHDAAPREGGVQVSLGLSSGLWEYPCVRTLRVQEKGLRRDEIGRSFVAPIIEFVNAKLPESKRLAIE